MFGQYLFVCLDGICLSVCPAFVHLLGQGSHKNLASEFKDFSRNFQGLNVCFPGLKCHYFQSNILASKGATIQLLGGGGAAVFLIEQFFYFASYLQKFSFFTLCL